MRSGTLPTPLIVGMGEAAAVAQRELANDHAHVTMVCAAHPPTL